MFVSMLLLFGIWTGVRAYLQGLPLWQLSAVGTQVGDEGLTHVARLDRLTHLFLDETKVTDAGIQKLAAMSGLEYVSIHGTALTDSGISDLQQAVAELEVSKAPRNATGVDK